MIQMTHPLLLWLALKDIIDMKPDLHRTSYMSLAVSASDYHQHLISNTNMLCACPEGCTCNLHTHPTRQKDCPDAIARKGCMEGGAGALWSRLLQSETGKMAGSVQCRLSSLLIKDPYQGSLTSGFMEDVTESRFVNKKESISLTSASIAPWYWDIRVNIFKNFTKKELTCGERPPAVCGHFFLDEGVATCNRCICTTVHHI